MSVQTVNMTTPQAAPIVITTSKEGDGEWDRYVTSRPDGIFYQLAGWGEVVRAVYGYETIYLTARRDGAIVGVLALSDVKSLLLGRSLISAAFTVGGGPLADTPAIASQLAGAAAKCGRARAVQYVELRTQKATLDGWEIKSDKYAGFQKPLEKEEAAILKAIPRKRRAEVRKAIKMAQGGALSIRHDQDVDCFYSLYAQSLRDLGTPVFPRKFIEKIADIFSKEIEISTVEFRGEAVASLVSFYFGRKVMPYFVGASPGARAAKAHDFLYWSLMMRAAGKGVEIFDFGRSKIDSGPYAYKKLWGFEPSALEYQYYRVKADQLPDVNPNNPKFAIFAKLWRRLPAPLANQLGPLLAPNFP